MNKKELELWREYSEGIDAKNQEVFNFNQRSMNRIMNPIQRKFLWWKWEEKPHLIAFPPRMKSYTKSYEDFLDWRVRNEKKI